MEYANNDRNENKIWQIPEIYPSDEAARTKLREDIERRFENVSVALLGKSILSRPIDLYRIGMGRKNILYVGAHHGAEYITSSVLYSFMYKILSANGKLFGIDKELYMKAYSIWIVPCLNPDGVEMTLHGISDTPLKERQLRMAEDKGFSCWQANARGVDLNHNYSEGFAEYKKIESERGISAGRTLYSGEYPESEPETRALAGLVRTLAPSLTVSLHTQGEEIYYFPDKSSIAEGIARAAAQMLFYKIKKPQGTACFGGLCDYTGAIGIPSLTLELGKGENPLPKDSLTEITRKTDRALFLLPTRL